MISRVLAAIAFFLAVPFFVFAQTSLSAAEPPAFLKDIKSEADINALPLEQKKQLEDFFKNNPAPSLVGPQVDVPAGTVACFDYYHFGSVQVDLSSTLSATVPGATIGFAGTVQNANTYPIVDGQIYVKIFRTGGDESLIHQNGYALVDQFALPDTFTLPANGTKDASFTWKVPENAPTGDYFAAFFFQTAKRYNLLGLSFTDDVVGNQAPFSVKSSDDRGVVAFDKNSVTKNAEPHRFAVFLSTFTKDEPVTITTKLVNPRNESVVVPVIWKLYAWDSLREETLKDTKTELVELKPKETKTLSYVANPIAASASYLVVETRDGASKSILDIRFVRDGVEETRINFPSITGFPLQQGKETALFSCVHSTTMPVVKDNILTLTLRDEQGNTIHTYKYTGDITGAMMGVKDTFTPDKAYDNFTLTATLERRGTVLEEVTEKYRCQDIDPSLCNAVNTPSVNDGSESFGKGAVLAVLAVLVFLLGALAWKLWKGKKSGGIRAFSLLFAILLSSTLLFGSPDGAEAKSVSWNTPYNGYLAYEGDPFSDDGGWYAGLKDFNVTVTRQASSTVADGATVSVGTVISFATTVADTDISWFGTGGASDSPYGHWRAGATKPPSGDYIGMSSFGDYSGSVNVALSINPSIITYTHTGSTAGLSCNASGATCTITSPGTVKTQVDYGSTYGKFYHYHYFLSPAMKACSSFDKYYYCLSSTDYTLDVPSQQISFTHYVDPANSAPGIPTLTPAAPAGATNTPVAITATSTDADGDTLRYGFDWDNNGSVDEWAPVSGYAASGTAQTLGHSWVTAGTYTIKVLAQDSKGNSSGWANKNIVISATVNGICGPADTATSGVTFASAPGSGWCQDVAATPPVSGSGPWTWTCPGSGGGLPSPLCQASPSGPLPQLEVCLTDAATLIPVAAGDGDSYTVPQMIIGNTKTFQTFYDPSPGDCAGSAPVTGGTAWDAGINTPSNAVSFMSAGVLRADANGSEAVSVSYNGQTITMNASVAPPACVKDCSNASSICQGEAFSDTNGCGTNNCTGNRYCDFNWREVAP